MYLENLCGEKTWVNTNLPCFVIIISVVCWWNCDQRFRLQRNTHAPEPLPGERDTSGCGIVVDIPCDVPWRDP